MLRRASRSIESENELMMRLSECGPFSGHLQHSTRATSLLECIIRLNSFIYKVRDSHQTLFTEHNSAIRPNALVKDWRPTVSIWICRAMIDGCLNAIRFECCGLHCKLYNLWISMVWILSIVWIKSAEFIL